jgi:hypothetical protein
MAAPRTAPKGVYRYRSHDEANRDAERWAIDAMVERNLELADRPGDTPKLRHARSVEVFAGFADREGGGGLPGYDRASLGVEQVRPRGRPSPLGALQPPAATVGAASGAAWSRSTANPAVAGGVFFFEVGDVLCPCAPTALSGQRRRDINPPPLQRRA